MSQVYQIKAHHFEFNSTLLPCKHIFYIRKHLGLKLFDKNMIPERWKIDKEDSSASSIETLRKRRSTIISDVHTTSSSTTVTNNGNFKNPVDKSGKYTALYRIVQNGVSKAADDDESMYNYKTDTIKRLFEMWDQGLYVNLVPVKPIDMPVAPENISTIEQNSMFEKVYELSSPSAHKTTEVEKILPSRRYSEEIVPVNDEPIQSLEEPITQTTTKPVLIMAKRRGRPNEFRVKMGTINATHKYKPSNVTTTSNDMNQEKTTKVKLLKKDKDLLRDFFNEILEKSKHQILENIISCSMKIEEEFLTVSSITKRAKMLYDHVMAIDVDGFSLHHYFTADGFNQLNLILSSINDTKVWTCYKCDERLEETAIGCDYCNEWWHLTCAKLKCAPKSSKWYCLDCKYTRK
jgi:ribosomal protein L24